MNVYYHNPNNNYHEINVFKSISIVTSSDYTDKTFYVCMYPNENNKKYMFVNNNKQPQTPFKLCISCICRWE